MRNREPWIAAEGIVKQTTVIVRELKPQAPTVPVKGKGPWLSSSSIILIDRRALMK